MYNEKKTAQMAGYLLRKHGCEMNYVKLMKLLYLADRESMERYGESMSGDSFVSMDLGPVLSSTYDRFRKRAGSDWHDWIKTGSKYFYVFLNPEKTDDGLFDELSMADADILNRIYGRYAHYETFDLVHELHNMCKEWRDPYGSSVPITYDEIFAALGNDKESSRNLSESAMEKDEVKQFMASMA